MEMKLNEIIKIFSLFFHFFTLFHYAKEIRLNENT